ncbi:hypothetical protein P0R31_00640 [Bradyrhizobium yuanmingense]|uniref:hypothetical protein n=1 Tax=Bradyrhizobium yuanmingense TaxID=108015 RepID=UPI0023B8F708|nr:hypothetical protein [Bradyrhizobium yuanmingense]MDF0515749.1 hypothetical protein [Bradyrhizobium yuanmingense]
MESWLIVLVIAGGWYLWQRSKNVERAKVANERLAKDNRLYERIKAGMREYHWRERDQPLWRAKHCEMVFETAHLQAFHLDNFAETRVGFYFKDINEYGMYSFFAGNGDDFIESYYRTDSTFQKEGMLLHDGD